MANTRGANVIIVDTSAAFSDARRISSIKYIGGTGGSASIKKTDSSGVVLWEESGTSNVHNSELDIVCTSGVYVTVAGTGTKVYLYLESDC